MRTLSIIKKSPLLPQAFGVHSHDEPEDKHNSIASESHKHDHGHDHSHGDGHGHGEHDHCCGHEFLYIGLYTALGALLLPLIEEGIHSLNGGNCSHGHSHDKKSNKGNKSLMSFADIKTFGLANLLVEALHNFVDGLAIGISFNKMFEQIRAK